MMNINEYKKVLNNRILSVVCNVKLDGNVQDKINGNPVSCIAAWHFIVELHVSQGISIGFGIFYFWKLLTMSKIVVGLLVGVGLLAFSIYAAEFHLSRAGE
jgi:hypothetical protein